MVDLGPDRATLAVYGQAMLTEFEALDAMREFLRASWERGGSKPDSDLVDLLSSTHSPGWGHGGSKPPKQWHNWLAAIDRVKPPAEFMRVEVLLSVHHALWQMVTPDLRGVTVSWDESWIRGRCLYDTPDVTGMEEIVSLIETYVIADFSPTGVVFVAEAVPVPAPLELRAGENWVYLRMEDRELYE